MFEIATSTPEIELLVGGKIYGGWLTYSVVRSLEAASGAFDLTLSDRWPGQSVPWPISPGDECELLLNGETLITGYVDEINFILNGEARNLTVRGRDKSADLVDCSYIEKPDQWRGADIATIAADLAAPFGVSVNAEKAPPDKIPNFKVEPGETAWEALDRLCTLKGLLVYPDAAGGLIIASPGTESLGLVIAQEDCINLNVNDSHLERYSEYLIKGQRPCFASGADAGEAKTKNQTKDAAQDKGVKRYRPLLVLSEGAGAEAAQRAAWEAASRAGKGLKVSLTLPGFTMPSGGIWPLDKLISVAAPALCLGDELLISGVKFDLSLSTGRTSTLTLCRPDAFKPEPLEKPKGGGGAGGGLPPGTEIVTADS